MKLTRALPSFFEQLTLELLFSIGIIFAVMAVLLPGYQVCVERAEMSKLLSGFGSESHERMIGMALSGEVAAKDDQMAASGHPFTQPQIGGSPVSERIVNGGIRYEGKLGKPFFLTFTPSVNTAEPTGNILWLCGNQKAPPGWTQPAQPGTDLPPKLIPQVCRD
jgi:hypothetical protein